MRAVQPYPMPESPNDFYGVQRRVSFAAGAARTAQLCEGGQTALLWRLTAGVTNGTFRLSWGTFGGTHYLEGLLSPLAVSIPGAFTLQVTPTDTEAALDAVASLSVSSGGLSVARSLVTTLGALHRLAARVTALAAATVTVAGTAVVLAAGDSLDVGAPAVLTAGGPLLVEYAL